MQEFICKSLGLKKFPSIYFDRLLLGAPLVVWFSFQPLIRIGRDSTMHFELSVTVVYVAILALVGASTVWQNRKELWGSPSAKLVILFLMIATVGLIWGVNLIRGLLTVGVIGSLALVFLASLVRRCEIKKLLPALVRLFVASAVFMSLLSIAQFIAGIWLDRDLTLLCAGCVAGQFGFPRPNVFTIEPQFFGSLLLAPALISLRQFVVKRDKLTTLALLMITMALFLTMSRGAIFAFAIGVVVLFLAYYRRVKTLSLSVGVVALGFLLGLMAQGLAAELSPTLDDTFRGAVSRTVNQMSLGVVDVSTGEEQQSPTPEKGKADEPRFDGYVAESTDIRVGLSSLALQTWSKDAFTALFGVGVGGSGVAMHESFPRETDARQIVQNEYLEIILEMGLVGFGVLLAIIFGLVYKVRENRWLWSIVAAFLIQWGFFSGYPNALHIYLVFVIIYVVYATERRGLLKPAKRL